MRRPSGSAPTATGIVAFAAANDPERAVGIVNDTPQALDAEHDNLRAALSSGLAEDPAVALRLAVSLWRFWLARGDFSEASRWLAATLAARAGTRRRREPARCSPRPPWRCAAATPPRRQIDLGIEAVAIMRAVGDDRALAQTLHLTGLLAWVSDHGWQRAVDLVQEARTLAAAVGDAGAVASATHTLGVIAVSRGAGAQAEEHFEQVLGLLEGLTRRPAAVLLCRDAGPLLGNRPGWAAAASIHRDRAAVPPRRDRAGDGLHLVQSVLRGEPGRRPGTGPPAARGQRQRLPPPAATSTASALALCRLANVHRIAGELDEAGRTARAQPGRSAAAWATGAGSVSP